MDKTVNLIQLDDGTLLHFNSERRVYEVVTLTEGTETGKDGATTSTDFSANNSSNMEATCTEKTSEKMPEQEISTNIKINWNYGSVSMLIDLVNKHDEDFNKSLKKHVWKKIATILTEKQNCMFTTQQCDTKWKGLVETYKNVKKHNETTGNSRKDWPYFKLMENALVKRPELNPVATCSSFSGLVTVVAKKQDNESGVESCSDVDTPTNSFKSRITSKRRNEGSVERRHSEKLARQDRFLELFEDLVSSIKQKE